MEITQEAINDTINKVVLSGRMDFAGTQEIDTKFTAYTAAGSKNVIVEMSGVDFVASIGIRSLITNAKALQMKGKRLVLLHLQEEVKGVLDTAGITALLTTFTDESEAIASFEG